MRRFIALFAFVLLSLFSMANHGCPQDFESASVPPAAQQPGENLDAHLEGLYDGTLVWTVQVDAIVQGPNLIVIDFPFPLKNLTQAIVGTHNVDEDFKHPFERQFKVRRFSNNQAYVDFFDNATLDVGIDYEIEWTSGQVYLSDPEPNPMYSWAYHGGLVLDGYEANIGTDQYAFDVPVHLFFNASTVEVTKNLMLLFGAQILPHVPFGTFPGVSTAGASTNKVITEIVLTNSWDTDSEAEIEFYNAASGEELEVTIDGETAHEHQFEVLANGSRTVEVTSDSPLVTAWGMVYGDPQVEASTVFTTVETASQVQGVAAGSFVAEAGIAGTGVSTRHILDVVQQGEGVSTAFAVVNPTSAVANITLRLKDSSGEEVGQGSLVMQPKTQTARFATDYLSPGQVQGLLAGFRGSLEIRSDTDLAVISLRTLDGLQTSSLSSGSF